MKWEDFVDEVKKGYELKKEELIKELEYLKFNTGLSYEILNDKETKEYKKLWIDSILPKNVSASIKEKAYSVCTDCGDYLWHLFSFELVETMENPTDEFNKLRKKNCTLVFESNNFITVKLKNAEDLEEQDIIDFCKSVSGWACCDFVITADDFSWSYSRTHEDYEDGFGPYFYKKKKEQC